MYLKTKPKYPIRKWLGKYSANQAIAVSMNKWQKDEIAIEKFLRSFPRYRSLEHFTSADVADFRIVNPLIDLNPVHNFWEWLITKRDVRIRQIVLDASRPRIRTKSNLGIEDMLRLLDNCETIELKKRVINAVYGGKTYLADTHRLWPEFLRASQRAGMLQGFRLGHLKVRVAGRLGKGLIDNYCQQLLNALPKEPELPSHTFA